MCIFESKIIATTVIKNKVRSVSSSLPVVAGGDRTRDRTGLFLFPFRLIQKINPNGKRALALSLSLCGPVINGNIPDRNLATQSAPKKGCFKLGVIFLKGFFTNCEGTI